MLFNSLDFAIFIPIVFVLYWFVFNKNLKFQNILLLVASYFFYACWDWRFVSLIFISTIADYSIGSFLFKATTVKKRKLFLWLSFVINLGFLGFFKYYNFFIDSFSSVFLLFGNRFNISVLKIILPVGISFYTFQTLSYTIDIYRKEIKPVKSFIAFASFVSFFPQLVAGPIERAKNLLPQFLSKRVFELEKAKDGMRQVLWGLFKKMVVADNCALIVNDIFDNYTAFHGSTLLFGAFFFSIQIYCDFSGYTDIAIGISRLFGVSLKRNFAFPYFSRNIAEFWRRWHISLSTWFRDYLYIPLGGSRGNIWQQIRNVIIVFLVSGLWHGANWTFVMWGFIHALCFLPLLILNKNRRYLTIVAENRSFPNSKETIQMLITFIIVMLAWVFFRADTITQAINYLGAIFSKTLFREPNFVNSLFALKVFIIALIMLIIEWHGRSNKHALEYLACKLPKSLRWGFYYVLLFIIFYFKGEQQNFVYFQF